MLVVEVEFLFNTKMINPSGTYYGVEPGDFDEEDVKKHGLNVVKGTLEEAHYPDNYFDVITMNHVFEHVYNPSDTMKELKRILKPNGTLIIAVPNYNSLVYKIFGKYWYQLDAPRHLFIYSNKILIMYAKKFNFKIEKMRYGTPWDPLSFIVSGMHYFGKFGTINQKTQKGYVFLAICLSFLLIPLTTLLNILKFGDSVEIWMKK